MGQTASHETMAEFVHDSDKVNSVDLHPTKPCILVGWDSGNVTVWNYQTRTEEKFFKVSESPVRSAKFIARENWILAAGDDKIIHVYDYSTGEIIHESSALTDIIRSVAVHPKRPFVISAGDDNVVRVWKWNEDWAHTDFNGHTDSVMQVAFDPIDSDKVEFASASLDGTLKIWNLNSATPIFTLHGHSRGVNCVDYFINNNNLYLLSGSEDFTTKVWDYKTKKPVETLGHENNVTAVGHHPKLPIIITAPEDKTVKIWDAVTYKLKTPWNSEFGTVWSIGYKKLSDEIAFGCDKGFKVVKMTSSNLLGQASNQE